MTRRTSIRCAGPVVRRARGKKRTHVQTFQAEIFSEETLT